jgi:DNA topoisomerase-1
MAERKTNRKNKANAAGSKNLVIVESPAKARTINKYLGPEYHVMASVGHVRDLPAKNPKGVKDPVPGVDLDNDFKPTYQVIRGKSKTVKALKKAAEDAAGIWLATDLDREGEAIAWHLTSALGVDQSQCKRVIFNAITKEEIEKAFKNPRPIDMNKVNAQQARRILDRLVGYQVSPLLWRKVAGGLSAGRVQSVALRLIVEREREIAAFVPREYWRLTGCFTTLLEQAADLSRAWTTWLLQEPERPGNKKANGRTLKEKNAWLSDHGGFMADLVEVDGRKFAADDVDSALHIAKRAGLEHIHTRQTENNDAKGPARRRIRLEGRLGRGPDWRVKSIKTKRTKSRPPAPFITSTLQQSASTRLGFSPQTTMGLAQTLYEGVTVEGMGSVGLITYMRTDSTGLSNEAVQAVRSYIRARFGQDYLPQKANRFQSSNKQAQEAHEAIRPTDVNLIPDRVRSSLKNQQFKLYKMIWQRFVACQMIDAQWDATTALISGKDDGGELVFRASGRVLVFDGYYKILGVPNTSDEAVLPKMTESQVLAAIDMDPTQNFTSPPPRYTEASLIKKLEDEGIGRPSTYAQILQVILNRQYVEKTKNRFYATDLGEVVTDKLVEAFPEILQVGYTRDMEQRLDDIEDKEADWVQMLRDFYRPFKRRLEDAYEDMKHAKAEVQPAPHECPQCGGSTVYRFGRNGRFLSCSRYPDCKYAAPIDREGNPVSPEQTDVACPICGSPTLLRRGRFGPFLSCTRYPECDGIVNLDKKGLVTLPKTPPLKTDLTCAKCGAELNLRRGARGPWLSCSKFPKCRGRLGWASLEPAGKEKWAKALEKHEKEHPQPTIKTLDGTPISEGYKPNPLQDESEV